LQNTNSNRWSSSKRIWPNHLTRRQRQGGRPKQESRSTELRLKLITWKQTPTALRPSLRALARSLGTSHQLLRHDLIGLEEWQRQEGYRKANQEAEEIRARAAAENRSLKDWEARKLITALWIPKRDEIIEEIEQEAQRGALDRYQFKTLKMFARYNVPGAQELLQLCSQVGLKKRKRFAEIVKDTPRREGEDYVSWMRRIWDECKKYDTNCPTNITEELLDMYAQRRATNHKNNLPVASQGAAKSFRCE
jgi:hypothetical protein